MSQPLRPVRRIEDIEADAGFHNYVVTHQSLRVGRSWSRRVKAIDLLDARKRYGSTTEPFATRSVRAFRPGDEHLETMP